MSNYVLSLNADNKKSCYGVLFNKYTIEKFLHMSVNEELNDFIKLKMIPIIKTRENVTIILNNRGYGKAIEELLKRNNMMFQNVSWLEEGQESLGTYYEYAVDNLKNINNSAGKIKLATELGNLKVQLNDTGKIKLIKKDNNISHMIARCYLQGIAYIKYKDRSEGRLDYARFIYENDKEVYDLLIEKEKYIKEQIIKYKNVYPNNILSEMNKELKYTQTNIVKILSKINKDFGDWINIAPSEYNYF